MKKVILLFILLALPLVSATTITVKTLPLHDVDVYVLDGSQTYYNLQSLLNKDSGIPGEVTFEANVTVPTVDLQVYIKDYEGTKIYTKRFEDLSTTSSITVTLPETNRTREVSNQTNTTIDINQTNTTSLNTTNATPLSTSPETTATEDNSAPVTGNVASETQGTSVFSPTYIYYIIGASLLAAILFFIFKQRAKSSGFNQFKPAAKHEAPYVMQLEKKLKDAEHQINYLKNQEKIKDAEKRIADEKKEIDRLRRGF